METSMNFRKMALKAASNNANGAAGTNLSARVNRIFVLVISILIGMVISSLTV